MYSLITYSLGILDNLNTFITYIYKLYTYYVKYIKLRILFETFTIINIVRFVFLIKYLFLARIFVAFGLDKKTLDSCFDLELQA